MTRQNYFAADWVTVYGDGALLMVHCPVIPLASRNSIECSLTSAANRDYRSIGLYSDWSPQIPPAWDFNLPFQDFSPFTPATPNLDDFKYRFTASVRERTCSFS